MDQDGNTAMPQKPDFSSPNSTDADKQQIAAAAASMTESDPRPAITSASSDNSPARGMFGNRRFKAKNDAAPTTFAGAPDFFNQAAGGNSQDFVTVSDAPVKRSTNKVPIIIIIALVVVFAVVGLVAALMPKVAHNSQAASKQALNRIRNIIVYGEDKEDDLPEDANKNITDFYNFYIYKEATNSEVAGCPDMAEKVGEIAKSFQELADYGNKVQNICRDMQYQGIRMNEIIDGVDDLNRRDMIAFVEGYYDTKDNEHSKVVEIREKQATTTVDKIEMLVNNCEMVDNRFNVSCRDEIDSTEEYLMKDNEYKEYQFEINEIISNDLRSMLNDEDTGDKNE